MKRLKPGIVIDPQVSVYRDAEGFYAERCDFPAAPLRYDIQRHDIQRHVIGDEAAAPLRVQLRGPFKTQEEAERAFRLPRYREGRFMAGCLTIWPSCLGPQP